MIARLLAVGLLAGGTAGALLVAAWLGTPILAAGLVVALNVALPLAVVLGFLLGALFVWGRLSNERWRLALEADTRRMELQLAARRHQLEAQQGSGREVVTARYYVEGRQ